MQYCRSHEPPRGHGEWRARVVIVSNPHQCLYFHQVMENLKLEPGLEREISRMCLRSLNSVNLDLPDTSSPNSQRIQEFFLLMAICNTVVVTHHAHEDLVSARSHPWCLGRWLANLGRCYINHADFLCAMDMSK
jgi:hypothetical protein